MKVSITKNNILSMALIITLWQILSIIFKEVIIPSPIATFKEVFIFLKDKAFYERLYLSLFKLFVAVTITTILGTSLAIVIGMKKVLKEFFSPFLNMMLSIPPIAWMGIAVIWFGVNSIPSIFIIVISTTPIMFVNIYEAYINVDSKLLEMCYVYNISKKKIIIEVVIPAIKPVFKASMITIIATGWKLTIMSEVLLSLNGLGEILTNARMNLRTDKLFAISIILAFVWFVLDIAIKNIFKEGKI